MFVNKLEGLLFCYAKVNRCHFHRAVNFPDNPEGFQILDHFSRSPVRV